MISLNIFFNILDFLRNDFFRVVQVFFHLFHNFILFSGKRPDGFYFFQNSDMLNHIFPQNIKGGMKNFFGFGGFAKQPLPIAAEAVPYFPDKKEEGEKDHKKRNHGGRIGNYEPADPEKRRLLDH